MSTPTLYIFAGLPAAGKTTLARRLSADLKAFYLRIDTVEQALRDLCQFPVEGEGYRLAYRIAADNLKLGVSVVADSCNTIELTRREWEAVAEAHGARFENIEILCGDSAEHRRRVETRRESRRESTTESRTESPTDAIPNLELPTWNEVLGREYHSWTVPRIRIDTAGRSPESSYQQLRALLHRG